MGGGGGGQKALWDFGGKVRKGGKIVFTPPLNG